MSLSSICSIDISSYFKLSLTISWFSPIYVNAESFVNVLGFPFLLFSFISWEYCMQNVAFKMLLKNNGVILQTTSIHFIAFRELLSWIAILSFISWNKYYDRYSWEGSAIFWESIFPHLQLSSEFLGSSNHIGGGCKQMSVQL